MPKKDIERAEIVRSIERKMTQEMPYDRKLYVHQVKRLLNEISGNLDRAEALLDAVEGEDVK